MAWHQLERFCLCCWNKNWQRQKVQTTGFCPECNLSRRTPGLQLMSDTRPTAWLFIRKHYLFLQEYEDMRHMLRRLRWPPLHTEIAQGDGCNHFVECNRTNFRSEPVLMSRSLMCKSFSPSAKLIRSPHDPAQVPPRSLLHYFNCVQNAVRVPAPQMNTHLLATLLDK